LVDAEISMLLPQLNATFSRRLAVIAGVLLPALETIRRRDSWPGPIETAAYWLDDYVIGAFLLCAAWASRPSTSPEQSDRVGRSGLLTAAWGFACGVGMCSLFGQINYMLDCALGTEPSGLPHGWMIAIKATLLAIGVLGLIASMRDERRLH